MSLSKRRLSPWFLFALLLVLGVLAFRVVGVFLSFVLFGLFLAYLTFPIYAWLRQRLKRPAVAAGAMLLGLTLAVFLPLGFVLAELLNQVQGLLASLSAADPQAVLDAIAHRINAALGLPDEATADPGSNLVNDVYDSVQDALVAWLRDVPQLLAESILGLLLLAYVLYYTYTDGDRALAAIRDILPLDTEQRETLFREVGHVIRGVMYGTILLSAIQAVLAAIGFAIFGVPSIALWSVLIFVLALLPIVGAPFIWVPWGLYLIYIGETLRGVGLLVYCAILVNGIEHLIRPKLIGKTANIHPLLVLLGVVGGLALFGFIGFIVGPLVLSVFVTVLNLYRKEFGRKADDAVVAGPT